MSTSEQSLSERIFGALLRLLPFDFRDEFGSEMQQVFHHSRRSFPVWRRAGAALIACYVPARRAARIDPMVALRCD